MIAAIVVGLVVVGLIAIVGIIAELLELERDDEKGFPRSRRRHP